MKDIFPWPLQGHPPDIKSLTLGTSYYPNGDWLKRPMSSKIVAAVKSQLNHVTLIPGHAVSMINASKYRGMMDQNSVLEPKCGSVILKDDQ